MKPSIVLSFRSRVLQWPFRRWVTDAEKKIMARQFKEKIAQKRLTRLRRIEAAGAAE